jgi:uncharacterized protein (DUF2062 family)
LTLSNIKRFIDQQVIHSNDSNVQMAAAMGWGVFCGIIPIWGYQMVFAGVTAHFMRLNKVVAVVFSNISIPPMIPFILYGSMVAGAWLLNIENIFQINSATFESVGKSLTQYLLGSVVLATMAGLTVFVVALLVMIICKRKNINE